MKLTDTLCGALVLVFGAGVAAYASTFPTVQGQAVGPGLFPTIVGTGLAVFGLIQVVSGLRRGEGLHVTVEDWMRRPQMVRNGILVPVALLFYAAVVDRLGFLLTGVLFLSALFTAFGARRAWILPIAIVATLVLHTVFYGLLRVPLPWGVLEAIAW